MRHAVAHIYEPSRLSSKWRLSGLQVEERYAQPQRHAQTLLCIPVINDCTSNYTTKRWTHFSSQNDWSDSEAGQLLCNNRIVACTTSMYITPRNQLLKSAMIFPPSLILSFALILYSHFLTGMCPNYFLLWLHSKFLTLLHLHQPPL